VREAKEIRAALAGVRADHRTKTEVKRSARMQSVDNWQAAWDNSRKGRWMLSMSSLNVSASDMTSKY